MIVYILLAAVIFLGLLIYYLFYIAPRFNPRNRAASFEQQGLTREAIYEYKKILDENPRDPAVHFKLAGLFLSVDEPDKAALHLEEVMKIGQYSAEVDKLDTMKRLAGIYQDREDLERAFQVYFELLRTYPADEEALYHVSFIALGQEEFELAQRYFDRLVKLKPGDFDIQFGAGICSYQNQKINESVEYFKAAVALRTNSDLANLAMAFALQRKRDYKQAMAVLGKLAATTPDPQVKFVALRLDAFIHLQSKRHDEGVKVFQDLLEMARTDEFQDELPLVLYDIGFACIRAEKSRMAYDYWNELYQVDKSFQRIDGLITMLRKEMDVDYKSIKETFDVSVADYIDEWLEKAFPATFLWDLCGLKSAETINLKDVIVTTRVSAGGGGADLSSYRDYSEALARLSALDTESFRVMANRVVQKLGYKVDQILPTYRDTDGVDFMTVSVSTKEKTLIWVRRWTKITVGEIPLRNLAQSTNDLKARQGILITAAELPPAAEESLSRLSKVSVVHPDQLGEILDGLL